MELGKFSQINSRAKADKLREQIKEFIFCGDGLDTTELITSKKVVFGRTEGTEIVFDGPYNQVTRALHLKRNSNVTLIYCHGHGSHYKAGLPAIMRLYDRRFDVIALSMPLTEPNSKGRYLEKPLREHADFEACPSPLLSFMFPLAKLTNYAEKFGKPIVMTGVSGGGWQICLYAAIDPRIKSSYPVAGGIWPTAMRGISEIGDFEQYFSYFYTKVANYYDLFVLGAVEDDRKQIQIFNEFDECCFAGHRSKEYEPIIKSILKAIGSAGTFHTEIDKCQREHIISAWAVDKICEYEGIER